MPNARQTTHRQRPARRGHTLVELVVACVVFAVGVLGLQRALLAVLAQTRDAREQELATDAAVSRYERSANAACAAITSGSTQLRGLTIAWEVGGQIGAHARGLIVRVKRRRGSGEREDVFTGAVRCH